MKKHVSRNLLEGPIYQQLLIFFFPVMIGTFFQQLYNTIDAIVVGKYVGKIALAAVGGTTSTTINLLVSFITGLTSGATVIVAQLCGVNDVKSVKKAVNSGMVLGILSGGLMSIIGIVFAPKVLTMLHTHIDVYPLALLYMRIYFIGMIPLMIYNVGASILRAMGNSKTPLYFLGVSCIVNIALDILLVVIMDKGILGVGVATVLSQLVACILILISLYSKRSDYHFSLSFKIENLKYLPQICVIGLPMGLSSVMYSFSNLFVQNAVNLYGTDTMAAFTAFGKIDAIFWNINNALGIAALTFVGQNFGAGNLKRVKEGIKASLVLYCIIAIIISSITYFFGEPITRLFTDDENVISICMDIIHLIAPYWITFSTVEIFSSSIKACGDTFMPMLITAIFICVLRICWLLFYPCQTLLQNLACYPISWIITAIVMSAYYFSNIWLKRGQKKLQSSQN